MMDQAETIISGTKVHRPLLDETVTTEDWDKARVELNETPETRVELLKRFKERLAEEAEFLPRMDDTYLLRFLRVRKFDLERAYQMMKSHYTYRAANPTFFPAPSTIEKALRANIFNYLPHRDHMGRAIFVVKMKNWIPSEISYDEFLAAGNILSEYVLDNPVTQINGYIGLWDYQGFTLQHFLTFGNLNYVPLLVQLIQDCFPGRFKIAYCVNCHHLFTVVYNLFKPLLRQKFRNRVRVMSGNIRQLHQFIDPSILPREYGGSQPTWPCDDIVRRVLDKEEYFNYNRSFGYK